MKAGLLAIGSELLTPDRAETNALFLTRRLREVGVDVVLRLTVADDLELLTSAFREALARAELVIATGGLGPTEDDLTREAAAAALGRGLRRDGAYLEALRQRFASFGRTMAPVNEKQADVIDGGVLIPNPRGTAPAQRVLDGSKMLVLLPGPPHEMEPLFETELLPLVKQRGQGAVLKTRVLKIAAMGESDVEQLVAPIYKTFNNPRTTILSAPGQVELHLVAEAASLAAADALIESLAVPIRDKLAGRIYSEDGSGLPAVVAALLKTSGHRLAIAESCTGGLLTARLTEVAGASAFLDRSFVTYSNRSKTELLGVREATLAQHGAVSEEVARAMADGARRAAGADIGVGITGIAGPDGGTPDKPVGLVYVAIAGAAGDRVRRAHFPGERERIRYQATQTALEMLRRGLLRLAPL